MEIEKIYSEKAEEDIWSSLLKFTYTENLKRFFNDRQEDVNEVLIETISGSISQAYEYFSVSKNASLQVSPLLLYYGATNLLYPAFPDCVTRVAVNLEISGFCPCYKY